MKMQDKELIVAIVKQVLPQAKIYLFGSRARNDHRPESDIDIALDNQQKIDTHLMSIIKEHIEESTIPFVVDVVDIHAVSQSLQKEIITDGVLWY